MCIDTLGLIKTNPFISGLATGMKGIKEQQTKASQRSEFWKRVASKTAYEVEIFDG
jgi:hypothetical protein